ncbi:MAG: LysE family transporter [Candidatus Zixiibacteriota bacterium]
MNLFKIFGNSFLVGLTGALMPGPLLVVALARAPANGPKTGPALTLGHGIVELITVVILALGLAALVNDQPLIARVIAVVGGTALLLMALMMFFEIKRGGELQSNPGAGATALNSKTGAARLVTDGALATISNPYWFVWWATIGSALIVTSLNYGAIGPPVVFVGHILSDLVWYSFAAGVVWQGKSLLAGRRYQALIGVCALFLLWLGGWFIYSGLTGEIEL